MWPDKTWLWFPSEWTYVVEWSSHLNADDASPCPRWQVDKDATLTRKEEMDGKDYADALEDILKTYKAHMGKRK